MAAITTSYRGPLVDGTFAGIDGTFSARPTTIVDFEGYLGLPEKFEAPVVAGVVTGLSLAQTTAGVWAWEITVKSNSGREYTWYKGVPAGAGPIDFDDLDDIDPDTLTPTGSIPTLWQTFVNDAIAAQHALDDVEYKAAASETAPGIIELATQAEVNTGSDTVRAVTPATLAARFTALLGTAPANLDTLGELSDALADDANFAATMTTSLAGKAPLASPTFTGTPVVPLLRLGSSSGVLIDDGTGSPESVVTAPIGSIYTDTAVTNGASLWRKNTGSGNTGWVVVAADTGWRNIATDITNAWTVGTMRIRRVRDRVEVSIATLQGSAATADAIYSLPSGFRLSTTSSYSNSPRFILSTGNGFDTAHAFTVDVSAHTWRILGTSSTVNNWHVVGSYITNDAWPSSLPGTAA